MVSPTVCVLACLLLQCTSVSSRWEPEVINEDKAVDRDTATQQELLWEENLIPFKAPRPRPSPSGKAKPDHHKATLPESPKSKEEELVFFRAARDTRRHILTVSPTRGPSRGKQSKHVALWQDPRQPQDLETVRLDTDEGNLSKPCEDSVDKDCLFDVDDFLAKMPTKAPQLAKEDDWTLVDTRPQKLLSRHKRDDHTDSDTEEGSGTSSDSDELYLNQDSYEGQGLFAVQDEIGLPYSGSSLDSSDMERYQTEIQAVLTELFGGLLPGFVSVEVGEPTLENGQLKATYTILIDGSQVAAAATRNATNVEDYLLNSLGNSVIPAYNQLTIFGDPVEPGFRLGAGFVDNLRTVLDDYCQSEDPCPDAGPEFDRSACVNTGFMSGSCPHKCSSLSCQNGAVCELNSNYDPFCNCGSRYSGEFCETAAEADTGLTSGETVGVAVAGAAGALAVVSLGVYLAVYRRGSPDVNYSYYEDEGESEHREDPTSVRSFYVDRPIISTTPVSVFTSAGAFDA